MTSSAIATTDALARRRVRQRKAQKVVAAVVSVGLLVLAADLLLPTHDDGIPNNNNIITSQHKKYRRYLLAQRYVRSKSTSAKPRASGNWMGSTSGVDTRPRFPDLPSPEAIKKRQKMLGIAPTQQQEKEKQEEDKEQQTVLTRYADTPADQRPYLKLRPHPGGRIGNDLFAYASSYALAKAYSYNLCLVTYGPEWEEREYKMEDSFQGPFQHCDPEWENSRKTRQIGTVHTDALGLVWDEQEVMRDITLSNREVDLEIGGHLQRLGNFNMYLDLVLERLTFQEEIMARAKEVLGRYREEKVPLVGIHARRGDMMDSDVYNPGDTYYQQAIDRMRSDVEKTMHDNDNYDLPAARPKFLVFSEGYEGRAWFDSNHVEGGGLFSPVDDFVYVGSDDAMLDLAVLSSCDHNIISGGTFSFWSALLGGKTRNGGGEKVVITSNNNYGFPEGWILIDGDSKANSTV